MLTTHQPELLDTTLRDGSYTIEYKFSLEETVLIAKGLEQAGAHRIEVGHGLGLGASRAGHGSQAATDLEYMRACKSTLSKAKFGFFYIPGIATLDDLKVLALEGGGFVRIGIEANSYQNSYDIIKTANDLGIEVWVNFMKSNAYTPDECAIAANSLVTAGATGIYIVDSVGGMLPETVSQYIRAVRKSFAEFNICGRVGFHGHDNLGLAVSCSLSAVQAGADIVDGTLLGIGRSTGNAATEVLAMVLNKAGFKINVDPWKAYDLADIFIKPFLKNRWRQGDTDRALGFNEIHSAFLPRLQTVADEFEINLRDLILNLDKNDKSHVAVERLENIANKTRYSNTKSFRGEDKIERFLKYKHRSSVSIDDYIHDIKAEGGRLNLKTGLVISNCWGSNFRDGVQYKPIRVINDLVLGLIEVCASNIENHLTLSLSLAHLDFIFKDVKLNGLHPKFFGAVKTDFEKTVVLPYSDDMVTLQSICFTVVNFITNEPELSVSILGKDEKSQLLRLLLASRGVQITEVQYANILIILDSSRLDFEVISKNLKKTFILSDDATVYSQLRKARLQNLEIYRVDPRSGLSGELSGIKKAYEMQIGISGRRVVDGITMIAGGILGNDGDVVIDALIQPEELLGIADGFGGIKCENDLSVHERTKISSLTLGSKKIDSQGN
jgi:4-hydroxy-2-oxovalerate aldolase